MNKLIKFFALAVCITALALFTDIQSAFAASGTAHAAGGWLGRILGLLLVGMAAAGASSSYSNNWSSIWHKILGAIWEDEGDQKEPIWKGYLEEKETDKKYFDDVELVDPGLWSETDEGTDLDLDDFGEGIKTRYEPKKFSKRLIIPEELEEDAQYEEVYDATRKLRTTERVTEEYDAVGILNSAFDTNVTWGDNVAMCVSNHPIRGGSTVSNIPTTPLSPSNTAVAAGLIIAEKMPGSNGFRMGVMVTKVVCPTNQKFRFREILKSEQKDDTNNNAINALKGDLSSTPVSVPFMSSTTNWFLKTDVKRGALFVYRRKPRFRRSNDINNETKIFTGSARWVTGVSNWRTFIGFQA